VTRALDRYRGVVYADEVGLGKSWVAAAIARAWQKRGLRTALVVPAPLVGQWRALLRDFFVDAVVVTHESLLSKPLAGEARLLVVDEAHRFRNPATRRYRELAIQALGRSLLLVTATPLANRPADLLALFRLFAPDDVLASVGVASLTFAFESLAKDVIRVAVKELVVRRGREVVPEELEFGTLGRRGVLTPSPENERDIRRRIEALEFPLVVASHGREPLRSFLRRRLESSEAALAATLRRQRRFYRRAREALLEGSRISRREILRVFGDGDEDLPFQDLLFKPFWFGRGEPEGAEYEAIDREIATVESLLGLIADASPKAVRLMEILAGEGILPALVFTGSVATARDLFRRCRVSFRCGMVSSRLSALRSIARPESVFSAFMSGEIDVLIATDVGAEGLNLQRAATVVHYDLPWNPVRIDQRNGRAHRIGQERELVQSILFLPRRGRQDEVLAAVVRKNRRRRMILDRAAEHVPAADPGESCDLARPADPSPCIAALVLPPSLEHRSIRFRWLAALSQNGRDGDEWQRLLSASYPAGVDLWLARHAAEAAARGDHARRLLRSALPPIMTLRGPADRR
jgi:superfamily II DNA or RNA helicase